MLPGAQARAVSVALDEVRNAALLPEDWPIALDRLGEALGAMGAALVPKDPQRIALGFPCSHSVNDLMVTFIQDGWYRRDVRAERGWSRIGGREPVLVEDDLTTDEERRRLPYYQDLFWRFGVPWWGGMGFWVDSDQWVLTLLRGSGQGAYEQRDLLPYVAIIPELERIVRLATSFRCALDARTLEVATSREEGLITLDANGLTLDVNPTAATSLGGELNIRNRRLVARSPFTDRRLQDAISRAVNKALYPACRLSVVVPNEGKPPVLVELLPLPRVARDVFTRAVALVMLRRLTVEFDLPVGVLELGYHLTPAEARLATLIGSGKSIEQASHALGNTVGTARTVLKRVCAKMAVSRQAELAALIAQIGRN